MLTRTQTVAITIKRTDTISLPTQAEFLRAEYLADRKGWTTWWCINPQTKCEDRKFITIGTGGHCKKREMHLFTAMDSGFAWHLFEIVKETP